MPLSFSAGVRDSLSNLAASLGVGRDKATHDAFGLRSLERAQIEAMYRGDWLARKTVDIVPYDSIRAWRAWSGHRADVDRMEAAERRLGLRKAIQRAMVLGRLYGGGAILIGTGETDPAALAQPLDERLPRGGLAFLHVVSRWQLGVAALDNDPLSQWVGEPALYELSTPGRPALALHPSRVVRFLGHPLPDPTLSPTFWSDSTLQVLYDAIHAVALTTAGATSLMHEAKVDIVTVPNLSEHLSSAETTQQLSARFAYAAAMKSINNLLLLGDGETWSRQSVDFGGLPEMVRTFLQVAAGAADIPVTRLLGQSPAGLSATGNLGEVKREGLAFTAELRSMAHRLNQTIGSTYSRSCEAQLGDARCKVDLSQATLRSAFSASTGTAGRVIAAAGLSGFASDWFTAGTLTFSTGAIAAIPFEVKSHRRTSGIDQLELWLPPPFPIATGDTGTVVAGCRKTLAICKSKFDNVANFRGFPHIPGTDAVTRYGVQGALDTTGGSLFGSNG